MKLLIFNVGSSSIKYFIYQKDTFELISHGTIQEIGKETATIEHYPSSSGDPFKDNTKIEDVKSGLIQILSLLTGDTKDGPKAVLSQDEIYAVGHRVVHGGGKFTEPTLINQDSLSELDSASELAPLHNKANLAAIRESAKIFGDELKQVAIFDSAFHVTLPPHAYSYALPSSLRENKHIRRYGFHGISYKYLTRKTAEMLGGSPRDFKMILLHLGNGSSACAVKHGESIDTSMGLTPLEGLMMGTRCGDIDAAVVFHIPHKGDNEEIERILNKESGFKGMCGESDLRKVLKMREEGSPEQKESAALAFDVFCYRLKKYIGSYFVALDGVDVIVFSGGIGENSAAVRQEVCKGLGCLGVVVDEHKNNHSNKDDQFIEAASSRIKIGVVHTNEALQIAHDVCEFLNKKDVQ